MEKPRTTCVGHIFYAVFSQSLTYSQPLLISMCNFQKSIKELLCSQKALLIKCVHKIPGHQMTSPRVSVTFPAGMSLQNDTFPYTACTRRAVKIPFLFCASNPTPPLSKTVSFPHLLCC
jgi:hypothetical protein